MSNNLFKNFILWAENAANEDAELAISEMGYSATKNKYAYTKDDPFTLDRVWNLCVRYLMGSKRWVNQQNWQFRPMRYGYGNDNQRDNTFAVMIDVLIWLSSGIAFQRGLSWGQKASSDVVGRISAIPGAIIGGIGGGIVGTASGIGSKFTQQSDPLLISVKTGIKVGGHAGYNLGQTVGSYLGIIPGVVVGSIVGLGASLSMGALTLVAGTAKLAELTIKVATVVLNPFAYVRGVKNVYNRIANNISRANNYVKQTYEKELSKYEQDNPSEVVNVTPTAPVVVVPPTPVVPVLVVPAAPVVPVVVVPAAPVVPVVVAPTSPVVVAPTSPVAVAPTSPVVVAPIDQSDEQVKVVTPLAPKTVDPSANKVHASPETTNLFEAKPALEQQESPTSVRRYRR